MKSIYIISLFSLHLFTMVHLSKQGNLNIEKVEKSTSRSYLVTNKTEATTPIPTVVSSNNTKPPVVIVPAHQNADDDNAEETFTYQVKRQVKQWNFTPFTYGMYGLSANKVDIGGTNEKKKEDEIKSLKLKLRSMEEEVKNLTMITETMQKSYNLTEETNRRRIENFQKTITALMQNLTIQSAFQKEIYQNTSLIRRDTEIKLARKADVVQLNAVTEQIKPLLQQIQAINVNFDLLRRHKVESDQAINEKIERIDQKVQLLTRSVENSAKINSDKHADIKVSIGQFAAKIHNISDSVERMERELEGEERIIENVQDTVHIANQKISEIEYSGGEHWTENTNQCGGVLIAQAGLISYKFRQPYQNNERCIWTVRANRKEHVVVQLLEDNFQNRSNSDFITVSHFQDGNATALVTVTKILHGDRRSYTFQGPIVFVTFQTDNSIEGKGFVLKFEGSGKSSNPFELNAMKYTHLHLDQPAGFLAYPIAKDVLYIPNELSTIVINPPPPSQLTIIPRYADFETETTCQYDSVSFYKGSSGSYSLHARYCQQDTIFDSSKSFVTGPDKASIVTFTSDSSNQFKGFQFSWGSSWDNDL